MRLIGVSRLSGNSQFVDAVDKFPMAGKGDFDILNVHSRHVETVVLMSKVNPNK